MEKLSLRKGTKCLLSWLQKASSFRQVEALDRTGSGHDRGQRSPYPIRKPNPPTRWKEKRRSSRECSEISGNPLGGWLDEGCVGSLGGRDRNEQQEEPGILALDR